MLLFMLFCHVLMSMFIRMYIFFVFQHRHAYVPPCLESDYLVGFDGYSSKDVLMRVVAQGLNPETTTLDKVRFYSISTVSL